MPDIVTCDRCDLVRIVSELLSGHEPVFRIIGESDLEDRWDLLAEHLVSEVEDAIAARVC